MKDFRDLLCKRCGLGNDDDGDGNCAVCARWDATELARVRKHLAVCIIQYSDMSAAMDRAWDKWL